jgi:hypothetical protein
MKLRHAATLALVAILAFLISGHMRSLGGAVAGTMVGSIFATIAEMLVVF